MKISKGKLELVLARGCKSITDLRLGTSPQTLTKASKGGNLRPSTVGRIAKALGVDVAEIIEQEV